MPKSKKNKIIIMNFKEFAESRKSVRGFLDKPVPKELVDEIIDAAKWAPTSYNTQTWHIHAVAGDVLNKIREGNIEETMAGKPHVRDFPYKEEYEGVHRQNQSMLLFNFSRLWALKEMIKKNVWIGC